MPVLSPCTDIKSLIEQYAGIQTVGKPSYVRGVLEYHSNCPWCPGSEDSFITCPETGRYSHAIRSKGCGRTGDMIDFLEDPEMAGMTRYEACLEIGIDPEEIGCFLEERRQEREHALLSPPSRQWQQQGQNWLHLLRSRNVLRSSLGTHALTHLYGRGFTDATIQKFDLQYIPLFDGKWKEEEFEDWGLDPADFKNAKLKLPEGIVIPWVAAGHLWKLEVRRLLHVKNNRYMPVDGSCEHTLFNSGAIQPGKPVVLTESALDAMAGDQVAGDLATFVATGGTGKAKYDKWVQMLDQAPYVLVAFDDDEPDENGVRAGDKGAEFWLDTLPNAIRWVPWAHDVSDMLRDKPDGSDIREWLLEGMETYELIEKAKKVPVKPTPQLPEAGQSSPQGSKPRYFGGLSHLTMAASRQLDEDEVVQIACMLTGQGVTFTQVGKCVAPLVSFPLATYPQLTKEQLITFVLTYELVLLNWIQQGCPGARPYTPQPQAPRVPQPSQTCCKCSAPAAHYSPSGYGYCTEHYVCAAGHVPNWQQSRNGAWYCSCVVDRMPDKSRLN